MRHMAEDTPTYHTPEDITAKLADLEHHSLKAIGFAAARVLRAISNHAEAEAAAALLFGLEDELLEIRQAITALVRRAGVEGYLKGRSDGFNQCAKDLGLVQTPKEPPTILH